MILRPIELGSRDLKGLKSLLAALKIGAARVPASNLCTAARAGGGKPCKGDSGGPLMLRDGRGREGASNYDLLS